MAKQKLEQYVKDSLNNCVDLWFVKLINNHFTKTPADFIIVNSDGTILLECKQIQYVDHNSSFPFARLTQESELYKFEKAVDFNRSFILFMFWTGRLKTSYIYLIPLSTYMFEKEYLLTCGVKSINVKYFEDKLLGYKVMIKEGRLELRI